MSIPMLFVSWKLLRGADVMVCLVLGFVCQA